MKNWIDMSGIERPEKLPSAWNFRSLNEHLSAEETAACGDTLLLTMFSEDLSEDDLFAVCDHINLSGLNPLRGHNNNDLGVRFPDMSHPYAIPPNYKGEEITIRAGQHPEHPVNGIEANEIVYQTILAKHQQKTVYALIYGREVDAEKILKLFQGE
ncbi:MAG: hypothetical protein U9O95_01085 [Candidatus Marinimicrobia bacterium]|nr:hypothetical protein [Candidatus Neomarinimicrobiota bacterium]